SPSRCPRYGPRILPNASCHWLFGHFALSASKSGHFSCGSRILVSPSIDLLSGPHFRTTRRTFTKTNSSPAGSFLPLLSTHTWASSNLILVPTIRLPDDCSSSPSVSSVKPSNPSRLQSSFSGFFAPSFPIVGLLVFTELTLRCSFPRETGNST